MRVTRTSVQALQHQFSIDMWGEAQDKAVGYQRQVDANGRR